MKKLILLSLVALLPGCALFDAYLMSKYDNNEYRQITEIRAEAQLYKTQCTNALLSTVNAEKLAYDTRVFALYVEHIPHNENVQKSAVELNKIAQGLVDQYQKSDKVSPVFCKIKFETVEKSADSMQKIIGAKPR